MINENKTEYLFLSFSYFDLYFYLNLFFGILYLYIFGIMLLNIDYYNNGYFEKIINILFCVKKFYFYYGNGKNTKNTINYYIKNKKIDKYNFNSYFKDDSEYENIIPIINETYSDSNFDINSNSSEDSSNQQSSKFNERAYIATSKV